VKGHFWITCRLRTISCLIGTRVVVSPEGRFFIRILPGRELHNLPGRELQQWFLPQSRLQCWVANPVSHSITANKVVWGRTSTEVKLLSRILFGISLVGPKRNPRRRVQLIKSKRKRKPRPRLRRNRGL
jgi:hypothetical protein